MDLFSMIELSFTRYFNTKAVIPKLFNHLADCALSCSMVSRQSPIPATRTNNNYRTRCFFSMSRIHVQSVIGY